MFFGKISLMDVYYIEHTCFSGHYLLKLQQRKLRRWGENDGQKEEKGKQRRYDSERAHDKEVNKQKREEQNLVK